MRFDSKKFASVNETIQKVSQTELHEAKKPVVKIGLNPKKKIGYRVVSVGPGNQQTVEKSVDYPQNKQVKEARSPSWQRAEGKNPEGGLNQKGIASYRRENPGSKLSMAVTTKPSKLKRGSKSWKRRKSFCARMGGMPGPMKKPSGKPTRKALALRKWNCS